MKKLFALVLAIAMILGLAACGDKPQPAAPTQSYKVGMVCIGDANQAYDRNFYMAADNAVKYFADKGVSIEWVYKYNNPVEVADDCAELAEDGCIAVFCNSYGQEAQMLMAAKDYPDVAFAALTNYASQADQLDNTINAFPDIFEGRYLAGVAAGCKLNELIEKGEISEDEAVLGYVGAYTYSEVISGYTAFFLGAQSVCPSASMKVQFIGSWGNTEAERAAAQSLIDLGAVIISQHSDNTSPATTAQENGCYHIGYNISMSDVAPEASIVSSRIDWTNYFVYVIETVINGEKPEQDYMGHGLKDGDVKLTELNTAIAAPGTEEAIAAAEEAIKSGALKIFDTSKFTVNGAELTSSMIDITADFAPDIEAVFDGYFHESYFVSAPQFAEQIDNIELVNTAF